MKRRVHFLVLASFSSTGGIEKFNRAFMKAFVMNESKSKLSFTASGMYDTGNDEAYISAGQFDACGGNRLLFVVKNFFKSFQADELILGHMNLALMGVLYKLFQPSKQLTIICHGIEVFEPVSGLKKKLLQKANRVLAVSNYTKDQLINLQKIDASKINVFPNTLDPFFSLTTFFQKPVYLQERYHIAPNQKTLFTLTRLNSEEGYKGYDKVIRCIPALKNAGYDVKYIIGGKADAKEQQSVEQLIASLELQQHVVLAGYIPDSEVSDHYLMADVFVMPSKGEGFGIVFLEAMACGLPVIAGNKDGSTEALQFGKLGTLVNPDSEKELQTALQSVLQQPKKPQQVQHKKRLQEVFLN
jgi:phosphatidyl-myo-inositol dimannoside synthase